MSNDLLYGVPDPETDAATLKDNLRAAFNSSEKDVEKWITQTGWDNIRVVRRGGGMVGSLNLIWMGQWFGGRSVPMVGISGVAVPPEHRSGGTGSQLMRLMLEEMYEKGQPLSTLYAATLPIYRRAGYEQAGTTFDIRVSPHDLDIRDRDLPVRPIVPDDAAAVEACYGRSARHHDGSTDRGPYLWGRVREPRQGVARGYLVDGPSGVEGYVYYRQQDGEDGRHLITLTDIAATTPAAARRLLTLLADHRSMATSVHWSGGPADTFLSMLGEQRAKLRLWEYFMLRIVDVVGAFEGRGYAPHIRGQAHFEIRDDVLPQNNGRYVLSVENGTGEVREGGDGTVRLDVRGLAAIYTAHWSVEQAHAAGLLDAANDEARAAAALFSGPAPWMADRF